ncbi:MAG TPA: AAA-like domain-containing protein [Chthonomonadaceae bacterium]|nr:AAA-like domain-containing protein [Chthonomonadaceae bacterium]
MKTTCRIEMFGGLRVLRDGQVVARFNTPKTGSLLAYMACCPNRNHPREELIELLWPEVEPVTGRNRLKQMLSSLRAQLEAAGLPDDALFLTDRATVRMDSERVLTDVSEFESALQMAALTPDAGGQASALAHAIALYRGGFLPGFYDDWILMERERLAEAYVKALLQWARVLEQAGDLEAALEPARRAVAADSLREEAHCALMRLFAGTGRPQEALRQYKELERVLKELGAQPSLPAQTLLREIKEGCHVPVSGPNAFSPSLQPILLPLRLESVGGAVPLPSRFYIARPADQEFEAAITDRDSIVLVKGPRQIGKTSLLVRGLQKAREAGCKVVLTDFQRLTAEQMRSADVVFFTLAESMVEQLDLDVSVQAFWNPDRAWNVNLERFLRREILGKLEAPLVWGLDEVDRLFSFEFGTDMFSLFRSWHNERSFHPTGPWGHLTLAMAHATEAHLFISDLDQSPFNVGTRLTLTDFTIKHVAELNRRYGSPLRDPVEVSRYFAFVGGSPYLVRRGLHEMVTQRLDLPAFETQTWQEDGPFHDHLHRLRWLLSRQEGLAEAVRTVLRGEACPAVETFYRLRSAGVLLGESPETARPRCQLYVDYLGRHLL